MNKSCFYAPTIIKNATSKMLVVQEEVSGPIAPIITVDSEAEATKLANATEYGLRASLRTKNMDKARGT